MRITLNDKGGNKIAMLRPQGGKQTRKLLGIDIIEFKSVLTSAVDFPVGAYFDFEGERYTLNLLPRVKKYSSVRYEYSFTFEAPCYTLRNAQYLFYGEDNDLARNGMADFPLVGTPQMFLNLVAVNANRIGGATWVAGSCIEAEAKEVSFSGDTCLGALQRLAQEFDTEFWFEDNKIHLCRKEATLPYLFKYGKGNSLYDIERVAKDTAIITRLYAFGSERNLPFGYRSGAQWLKLPAHLGQPYLEKNADRFGVIERAQTFDDVYPHRTGRVTGINTTNRALFFDSTMPFDLSERAPAGSATTYKYLQVGAKAKVKFNTGNLAGYEFELAAYKHASKQFTIIPINEKFGTVDSSGVQDFTLPNAALYPQVGDEYVLLDIALPDEYVAAAEAELLTKAQEYLNENCLPKTDYVVTPNEIEFTRRQWAVTLGATVRIVDEPLGINKEIRIVGFSRSLDNLYKYESVELADKPANSIAAQNYAEYTTQKQLDGTTNLAALANRRSSLVEDVTSNYTTDIDGGLILTTLIQMRGDDGQGGLKTNAGISGLVNEANPVRFWAGSDFENRGNAPFRVCHDGSVVASKATIEGDFKTQGTGKRIAISSAEGKMELLDSNNGRRVEINDGEAFDALEEVGVKSGIIKVLGNLKNSQNQAVATSIDAVGIKMVNLDFGTGDVQYALLERRGLQMKNGGSLIELFTAYGAGDSAIHVRLLGLPAGPEYLNKGCLYIDPGSGVVKIKL